MRESCPWWEGYPPYRPIFYRAFIWKDLSLLTESKLILHITYNSFKYSILISSSSFECLSFIPLGPRELPRAGEPNCLYEQKLARPLGLLYLQSEWPSTQGHPAPRANITLSHVNGSLLFTKKCMKSSIAWGGSVWRVTLLAGTTLLHVNRP